MDIISSLPIILYYTCREEYYEKRYSVRSQRYLFRSSNQRNKYANLHFLFFFEYLDAAENVYPRYFNTPNQKTIIEKLCALEKAEDGLIFSSGMAAISTVIFTFLRCGDHIVLQRDIYGGTHHFATAEFGKFDIQYTFVTNKAADIENAIRKNTRIIYLRTGGNIPPKNERPGASRTGYHGQPAATIGGH